MIDVAKLSDDEVAILTYALERFYYVACGDDYKPISEKTAGRLKSLLYGEYKKRELHWSTYQND